MAGALQRFSLKPDEVAWRSREGLRGAFRRTAAVRKPSPPLKSYSQYNLGQLDSTTTPTDEAKQGSKHMHGIYGLLARHIDVPQRVWDARVGAAVMLRRPSIFGLPLLHPYSPAAVAWRCAMLLFDLTFSAFWVPLNVGFCYASYGDVSKPCTRSDLAGGIVYVVNWILGFQMGAVLSCGSRRAVALDGPSVTAVYIAHGKFAMDLLASIPFFVLLSAVASPEASSGHARRLLNLLSLIRLVRMLRLLNTVKVVYQDSLSGHYRVSWISQRVPVSIMYLLILAYQFAVVVNLATSLMIMLAAYYEYDTTWYDGLPWADLRAAPPPALWYHAAYWVLTVLTTTGQGQAPRRLGEQIVSNLCSVYGMVFNGLVVGVVGRALMQASGDASALYLSRKKVGLVSTWARLRHLPLSLLKELQIFFADSELQKRDTHKLEADVIEGLPSTLRRTVVRHIVRPLVDKVHILSSAEPELRDMLAAVFRPQIVPSGHDLCRQGEPADRLWLVEWGTVVALRHKETPAHPTTGMACLLGEGVLLRGLMDAAALRPWTLRTTSVCKLWELHWEDLEPLLRVSPRLISIALHYVHVRLIRMLVDEAQHDSAWCELLVVLGRILKQPALLDSARDNLNALVQAREDDSSLPLLLASWLEAGIATTLELGGGPARKQGLVTMSMMMARRSRDAISAYSIAAPSTNFARYAAGGGGASIGRWHMVIGAAAGRRGTDGGAVMAVATAAATTY
ncbi:hypothetical protein GPECTOR_26g583 [Gonium pectorale]|uniref:Cyclic nucleotide-binding domain-containing protein n=1 Tax=Gonium pectorale TaxID=33097 RepID=A0A150GH34_GONPE|nr:hypothetical protein GPECTOR_26g583 [Gonium pectorale]|eukprot:KXZ48680.1 hypothetical protein GPECTOR_26g583 [Gonium pectorale]